MIYRNLEQPIGDRPRLTEKEKDRQGDPELVSTEGTVDGGICRFRAAHFEWLTGVAEGLGLSYGDIGKRGCQSKWPLFLTKQGQVHGCSL